MRSAPDLRHRIGVLAVFGLALLAWSMLAVQPCVHGVMPGAACAVASSQAAQHDNDHDHAGGECCDPGVCAAVAADEPLPQAAVVTAEPSPPLVAADGPVAVAIPTAVSWRAPPEPHAPRRPVWQRLGVMRL